MDTDDKALGELAQRVADALDASRCTLASAESCTGGWIAKLLTDIPGSSDWFEAAAVTYSNAAKAALLSVDAALIQAEGAVSGPVAEAMAAGAKRQLQADLAVAVSGIAGPGGGTAQKPVGTVWIAWAGPGDGVHSQIHQFQGGRDAVRRQAVAAALGGVLRQTGSA
ncbi:MAG: CinA family protein [Gammaproteobacteria bacterium]